MARPTLLSRFFRRSSSGHSDAGEKAGAKPPAKKDQSYLRLSGTSQGSDIRDNDAMVAGVSPSAGSAAENGKGRRQAAVPMDAPNVYSAVMVAAFGGVEVTTGHDRKARMHPAVLFLLCVPVFITQISAILFLRTDLDVQWDVYDPSIPRSVSLLKLKLVMVGIIYLANFTKLVTCISHLVFICNPLTWIEVQPKGGDRSGLKCMFSTPMMWPWPILALAMNVLVNYNVCVDSVSIILSAVTAKGAIFDSLAIAFVIELSDNWWDFCAHTFDIGSIDNLAFEARPQRETWTAEGRLDEDFRAQLWLPRLADCVVCLTTPRCLGISRSVLRIGHGANRVVRAVALMLLFTLFVRQLFVVLHAVDTLVLPAARDLCTEYQMMMEDTLSARAWRALEQIMLVNFEDRLDDRLNMQQSCLASDAPLKRMTMHTMRELAHRYSHVFVIFAGSVGGVLFLPTLAQASQAWCAPDPELPVEQEVEQIREQVAEMRQQLVDLEDRVDGQ